MIKKISILLLLFIICGCSSLEPLDEELENLGYTRGEVSAILQLNYKDRLVFKEGYSKRLITIISNPEFDITKSSLYFKFYKDYDDKTLFYLVNNNYINIDNYQLISEFFKNDYFILDNLSKYLVYYKDYNDVPYTIAYVNVGAYREPYVEYDMTDLSKGSLILANKWNSLNDYVPVNLVTIKSMHGTSSKSNQKLDKECYDAFIEMYNAAKEKDINFYIASGYRAHDTQVDVYNRYLQTDSQARVDTYSSRPGFSDHQTGLACDILSGKYDFDSFENSSACTWLKKNAHKYGFILRFPKDKTELTGYMYESWHYRYVGKEVAKFIYENNICFEEYYAYYINRNQNKADSLENNNRVK